ncbi:MAG: disulfide bond formation protein B [SAR324 cluster bacterium]|nr:disulfide bond formation protein B [SAR324 cluster bacterium]
MISHIFSKRILLFLILILSLSATLGSLYFSEIRYFIPCKLCWYQRIAMYPIVIISLMGVLFRKHPREAAISLLPLAVIGIAISSFHVILQYNLFNIDPSSCGDSLCVINYVNYLGFITIPIMSWSVFFLIIILSLSAVIKNRKVRFSPN